MIDEEILARLLAEHAEGIPVPDSAIGSLLAAAPQAERASAFARFSRPPPRVLAAAVTVVVVAAGVWVLSTRSGNQSPATRKRASAEQVTPSTTGAAALAPPGAVPGGSGVGLPSFQQQNPFATSGTTPAARHGAVPTSTPLRGVASPADNSRIVRTGTLDLKIARGSFGQTIGRITTIAAAAGGFIADERTFESATTPTGSVTIRVPSARFNTTVNKLRLLGKVVSASTRGVDVTGQYTDLQARLHAATATRDQYLVVLGHAVNIGDILAVQDRIQAVQTTIDQLQGQINELDNQTTFGTITISVTEPGPKAKPRVRPHHPSGVSVAWGNARTGFSRRVEGLISHSGSALVVLIVLLLLAGGLRLLAPRVRRLLV
jgi:hypothetical protein